MNWYRTAALGDHGDTLYGQHMKQFMAETKKSLEKLRATVANDGLNRVSDRFRGEVRRRILLTPPPSKLDSMSMSQLEEIARQVDQINEMIERYTPRTI